jgi:hypothetical protein
LSDGATQHGSVLGAVPLAYPDRVEPEMLGHLRLADSRSWIRHPAGQRVRAEWKDHSRILSDSFAEGHVLDPAHDG